MEREALERRGVLALHGAAGRRRKARGRALARRFPGALRELDDLSSKRLERRLADVEHELQARSRGATSPERQWVHVMVDFHALLREALAIKAWLAAHKHEGTAATLLPRFRRYFARSTRRQRPLADVDEAFLIRYLRPPRGRLLVLVWGELAARHGRDEGELKRMVLGD